MVSSMVCILCLVLVNSFGVDNTARSDTHFLQKQSLIGGGERAVGQSQKTEDKNWEAFVENMFETRGKKMNLAIQKRSPLSGGHHKWGKRSLEQLKQNFHAHMLPYKYASVLMKLVGNYGI